MKIGHKYKVVYRLHQQRLARSAVMVYLGGDSWSARPVAGTQELPTDTIISVNEVSDDTEPYLNKVVREQQ